MVIDPVIHNPIDPVEPYDFHDTIEKLQRAIQDLQTLETLERLCRGWDTLSYLSTSLDPMYVDGLPHKGKTNLERVNSLIHTVVELHKNLECFKANCVVRVAGYAKELAVNGKE